MERKITSPEKFRKCPSSFRYLFVQLFIFCVSLGAKLYIEGRGGKSAKQDKCQIIKPLVRVIWGAHLKKGKSGAGKGEKRRRQMEIQG